MADDLLIIDDRRTANNGLPSGQGLGFFGKQTHIERINSSQATHIQVLHETGIRVEQIALPLISKTQLFGNQSSCFMAVAKYGSPAVSVALGILWKEVSNL